MIDIAVTAVVLVAVEIAIRAGQEPDSVRADGLAYALGAAMSAPLLVRRRYPLGSLYLIAVALMTFYALRYAGFPPAVVLVVPLYTAVDGGRLWRALPVPVVFYVAGIAVTLRHGVSLLSVVDVFTPQIALVAVAMLVGGLVRSRRAYAAEVRQRLAAAELERERETERRVDQERIRIARELHDTVAHAIATITVQSGAALHLLDGTAGGARDALLAIRQTAKQALAETRATVGVLRLGDQPVATEREAGLDRLPDLLAAVRAAGLEVALTESGARDGLPGPVDHAAYRIVQESLTNVLRHAGQRATAAVCLAVTGAGVTIEVTDTGAGPAGTSGGHGLSGMRERAEALGGTLHAGPGATGGFAVQAFLPCEET